MPQIVDDLIVGQGLAGSAVAWTHFWAGRDICLIDRGDPATASRVSAGLMTPLTGKRLVRSPEFETCWPTAVAFYRRVEHQTGQSLLEEQDMLRLFQDRDARASFLNRSDDAATADICEWEGTLQQRGAVQSGIVMSPAGRLDVPAYLQATRAFFEERGQFRAVGLNESDDLEFDGRLVHVHSLDLSARNVILCVGAASESFFPNVPNNPARGDILTVRIPGYERSEVVHRSIWIAPDADGTQTVGATYDWDHLVNEPRENGRAEVLDKLARMVTGPVSVESHVASVRPTMRDYRPVVGQHPTHANLYILNGLGSKGTLRAPSLANDLLSLISKKLPVQHEVDYRRLVASSPATGRPEPLTQLAQRLVREVVKPGETVVDATVGNGFDTTFLAEVVTESGRVIGYDIQQGAIESTSKRLESNGIEHVELRLESHEQIATLAGCSLSAVMFNLGFLPRSDREITTQPASTVSAIHASVGALKPGGLLSVLCYRGHDGGPEEAAAVEQVLCVYANTSAEQFDVQHYESTPAKSTSPILWTLRKKPTSG